MALISWLRKWMSTQLPRRATVTHFRPRLEALEERTLLSAYTAANVSELIADVNAANKAGGTNTITLTAPTTSAYVLTAVNNTTNGANGLPVITSGDNLTILGNGDILERSTAAGTAAFRFFDVASGGALTLQTLTLQNGLAFGAGSAADGGAIYNQGSLTLSGLTVQNNIAQGSNGADGVITSRLQKGQSINGQAGADAAGGGIWSSGAVTLQGGTIFQDNQALGGQGGTGGELVQKASKGGDTHGNTGAGGAGFGGGLYEAGGSATVSQATIENNTASGGAGGSNDLIGAGYSTLPTLGAGGAGSGGGLYLAGGTLNLTNGVSVIGNQAQGGKGGSALGYGFGGTGGTGSGGGVAVAGGTATLASTTLSANDARGGQGGDDNGNGGKGGDAYGGGLYAGAGIVTLTDDTITSNAADGGGAGYGNFASTGKLGSGFGGGVYIVSAAAVTLDSFTLANTIDNLSLADSAGGANTINIDGAYTLTS